jgi:hypothetical protein
MMIISWKTQVREWRKTLSASVDAYREMLRREKVVSEELMEMGPMDKLAEICPKCFGPPVTGKKTEEPDYIVCMDGNFQHRRHLAASHELSEFSNQTSLFISPEEAKDMETCMNIQINEAEEHPDLVSMVTCKSSGESSCLGTEHCVL